MKRRFWYSLLGLLLAGRLHAQNLSGTWQGVEEPKSERYCPSVLRLQTGKGSEVFGVLYQEGGTHPNITVNFQMQGVRTGTTLKINHVRKLNETGRTPFNYWCDGSITFSYDATLEKLTGHANYQAVGECDTGEFVLYRIKLKSAAKVVAGALSTLRVSGRDVRWFADAELTQPIASGNSFPTRLRKTTTFYLTQDFYPSAEKVVVPLTIQVSGKATVAPLPANKSTSAPVPADSSARPPAAISPPAPALVPIVLPTVLFQQGTPELLPESAPALDKLAADLQANPTLRLRIAGHTDRLGEPGKNQVLSEQRTAAVKAYLVKAGIAADRLETISYGDTKPLYTSPDIRNRRVTVERL